VSEVLPLTNHAPDNGMTVNGRQLHQAVQISTYYTTWIQRAIEQAELV
jgi:phage anti-repressor protein